MKRVRTLLAVTATLSVLLSARTIYGQSALDGFDPNANGAVRVVVVQPDGKILLGGDFTTLSPNGGGTVTRNRIARLNADGTLDTGFDPNANGGVQSITLQPDGKVVVSGLFSGTNSIGGQARNYIARLDATTGLADSFDPNANDIVYSITLQADGNILASGVFTSIGGQPRNRIARLDSTTGLADSFNPNADAPVYSMALQADGKILAGGNFTSIGGQTRNRIARLEATTGLADSFDPSANNIVLSITLQAGGEILVGGYFTSIGGQARNRIARLEATTGLADSFDPNANNVVYSIVVQADGRILAGGMFTSIGGQARNRIARLDAPIGLADSFDPNANNYVGSIAVQPDGKILAGGAFTALTPNGGGAATRNRITRLETDGRLDRTFDLGSASVLVFAMAVQPDGKILIGGGFTMVLGVTRNNIARLNTDGTLDMAFDPNANSAVVAIAVQADGKILVGGAFNGPNSIGGQARNRIARLDAVTGSADSFDPNASNNVFSITVQADGKILTGGYFTSIGGQTRNYIARLDATTGLADSFDPNANERVTSMAVQADGKILVGGAFSGANSIGGQLRNHIARLDTTTGLADSFNPNANNWVQAIAVQADGKILVGGGFSGANSIGGQLRRFIARLDASTGLADSFDPSANDIVESLVLQADGKILAGGYFTSIGGHARNHIARLNASTGLAESFDPNANNNIYSLALQADGKILASGSFTSVGGNTRNGFARFSNDTAALQDLAVTPTTVTWARGGSSSRLARATFESSTDNVTYFPLGNGTVAGGNWTLTGLGIPTGQSIYIRARGYYRGGDLNGSESIAQLVRNVYLPVPPPTPTPTPTPTAAPTGTPTASPTPTPPPAPTPSPTPTTAMVTISGTVGNCSSPAPTGTPPASPTPPTLPPTSGVTMTLSGSSSGSTSTDGFGNYSFTVATGGTYTVTPSKASIAPAGPGITNSDVLAIQRHFLGITVIPAGCRLAAADANVSGGVNNQDVLAVQRFFLGFTSGTGSVGQYKFTPSSLSYPGIETNQSDQSYAMYLVGDATAPFANRDGGVSPDAEGGNDVGYSAVESMILPDVVIDPSKENLRVPVKSTRIDRKENLVGFQGDFTFDQRVVNFASEPVQKAGLTAGNWTVSGNVLLGSGPIRTLRISAFSNDFVPLSGEGTLFELKISKVSKGAQRTQLKWAAPPNNFIFDDADLNALKPVNAMSGAVTPLVSAVERGH